MNEIVDTEKETEDRLKAKEQEDLKEIMSNLTEQEKKYCQIIVLQKPSSKAHALRMAGSKASDKYLSKMAWEIEQRTHVQAYMDHLRDVVVQEAGLDIQEVINTARKCIEIAMANGKPRDAEPHNRLLAELGGFIRNQGSTQSTQVKVENNLSSDSPDADFKKLQGIIEH